MVGGRLGTESSGGKVLFGGWASHLYSFRTFSFPFSPKSDSISDSTLSFSDEDKGFPFKKQTSWQISKKFSQRRCFPGGGREAGVGVGLVVVAPAEGVVG